MIDKKALIFDFFGVICSEVAPHWIHANLPEVDEAEIHETYIRAVDRGESTDEQLFITLGEMAKITPEEVRVQWQEYIHINTELVEYIKELKTNYRIALCSNAWTSFIRPILDTHNLNELFEVIAISSEVGHTKPDPEMYQTTAQALQLNASDCVFIDDNTKNVSAADTLGMTGILYTTVAELKERLS